MKLEDMCYKYADYIINEYNKSEKNRKQVLNNKRLQKILFVASVQYARETGGKRLFSDDFEAWSYGPVIPEIYRDYSIFQDGYMFPLYPDVVLNKQKIDALDFAFKKTQKISTKKLIENAHKEGSPWYFCYDEKKVKENGDEVISKYNAIPHKVIYEYYKDDQHFNELLEE